MWFLRACVIAARRFVDADLCCPPAAPNNNDDDINHKDTCNMELVVGVEYHHLANDSGE